MTLSLGNHYKTEIEVCLSSLLASSGLQNSKHTSPYFHAQLATLLFSPSPPLIDGWQQLRQSCSAPSKPFSRPTILLTDTTARLPLRAKSGSDSCVRISLQLMLVKRLSATTQNTPVSFWLYSSVFSRG
ncbi:hypothetical protein HDV63DRAFT_372169 [Trichoderma sp. SZMC 28014]